jgi:TonB family protein
MDHRIWLGASACAIAAAAAPLATPAQSNFQYYKPAKLVSRGNATSPVAGAGTVVVQVLVNKDGTFKVNRVIRSTNHGDDDAALEVAKTSKYRPAMRGTTPQTAFYDFTLKFTSSGGNGGGSEASAPAASPIDQYTRMISAGNYSGAQSGLKTYLADHPDDVKAQVDLGVADQYLGQSTDAVAAFDKAGTLPPNVTALAAKAYNDAAAAHLKAGDTAAAVAAAKRGADLQPSLFTYNTLGFAELAAGSNDAAVADLEKARTLGQNDKAIKLSDRASVDGNLVSAYLATGKLDSAKAMDAEAKQLDPNETSSQTAYSTFYIKAGSAAMSAGKNAEGAAYFEQAAPLVPSQAAALYSQAAIAHLNIKSDAENVKAKADAEKALAIDPDDAAANFAEGIALANTAGHGKDALVYLNKADASAKKTNNTSFITAIENAIKQLSGDK